jgi:gliding motility-associated-like protein
MKTQLTICLVLFYYSLLAQLNLVPNGDFETKTTCNIGFGDIAVAVPWLQPTLGTSDYFNSCVLFGGDLSVPFNHFGYQFPHSGDGYAGIGLFGITPVAPPNGREYIQVPLTKKLTFKKYYVEFYTNLSNRPLFQASNVAINSIGAYLSDSAISSATDFNFNFVPQIQSNPNIFLQDTLNWMKISGIYQAHGGEQFLTIGNFNNDLNTDTMTILTGTNPLVFASYYYFDDVSIYEITEPKAIIDTSICLGDSILIGANDTAIACKWFPSAGLNDSTLTNPIASPEKTTWYHVSHLNNFGYLSMDSVLVNVVDCRFESMLILPNIFTPNADGINDIFIPISKNIEQFKCKIVNRFGLQVAELNEINTGWNGRNSSGVLLPDGIYYYSATAIGKDDKNYNLKGFVHLLH